MLKFLKRVAWLDFLLVIGLIVFDMSIHPLDSGPDRLIHDPAVYRLANSAYMPRDWYTKMAVDSGVYTFYAKLINASRLLHIPEEFWRLLLYVGSLAILYFSLIKIARLFTKNILVIPFVAILHELISTGLNQPLWLYGPFIQIDGGLAPRSIGVALSFLALYYLMIGSIALPAFVLGIATLIHVSNSLIVFSLFFAVWLIVTIMTKKPKDRQSWLTIARQGGLGILVYLLAGGWFALTIAGKGGSHVTGFATEKFIWSWIYLRAPYMALPLAGKYWWIRLSAHILSIILGWFIIRKRIEPKYHFALNTAALVGLGSVVYFFIFYFFAFVRPWLPGFEFYSIRVIYFNQFVAYLFISVSFFMLSRELAGKLLRRFPKRVQPFAFTFDVLAIAIFVALACLVLGQTFQKPKSHNLVASWWHITDVATSRSKPPQYATFQYVYTHQQPFLGPPDWRTYYFYAPNIVSFKSFGFTKEGLPEWYERLNDVTGGEIEKTYAAQKQSGRSRPVYPSWSALYSKLTPEQVLTLSQKYNFRLFLTYSTLSYPFPIVAEDGDYRVYQLP